MTRWDLEALRDQIANPSRRLARPDRAAVLIPIIDDGGPQRLLLTRRTDTVGTHKGHVAFPGGYVEDQDPTLRDTALRETWEEIGLEPERVDVLGELDDFPAIQSRLRVSPWVGRLTEVPELTPNPGEVARVFEVPLEAMSHRDGWRVEPMQRGDRRWPVYFFDYDGEVVWGLTGYIILRLLMYSPWGSPYPIQTELF